MYKIDKRKEEFFEKRFNNFFYLISLYIRKLLNIKNIILFFVFFFLLWTVYYSISLIIENFNSGNETNIIVYELRFKICILGIYFTFITIYSYIYLKKNNFNQIKSNKNTLCNAFIVFFLLFLFWGIFFILVIFEFPSKEKNYENGDMSYWYKIIWFLYLLMFSYNLIFIFLLSLISEGFNNQKIHTNLFYIFLIAIIIIQFILLLFVIKLLENDEALKILKIISFTFFILILILFSLNLLQRSIVRNIKKNNK
ncbi:MAG: hypothetical protein HPAVJP_3070 [Candidatus Hepatoplasma vulgare]|nr:MAG: hypothetical protein HPAVJP_3070 [Candidatus Hepatoplasma sp.]